ncbi:MAG: TVP38/TMEM64 family protein [Nanoarchaeota archaeon]
MKKIINNKFIYILIFIIFILFFIYSYFSKGLIYFLINLDYPSLSSIMESFGIFSVFLFVFIVILEVVLAPIPPFALYFLSGKLFGSFFGGILVLIGNLIGAFICFKIARLIGKKEIEKSINKKIKKRFDRFFNKYGGFSIFILRINPLTTSDLVSYLAGLTKIRTLTFLLTTGLGLIPLIFIQTYLGDSLIPKNSVLYIIIIIINIFYIIILIYLFFRIIFKKIQNTRIRT